MLNAICVIKLMCSKDRVSSIACLKRDLLSQHRGIFKLTITRRHLEKREIVHKNFHSKFWSLVDVSVRLGRDCDPSRVQISFVCATARQAGTQWEDQRSSVVSKLKWHTDSVTPTHTLALPPLWKIHMLFRLHLFVWAGQTSHILWCSECHLLCTSN